MACRQFPSARLTNAVEKHIEWPSGGKTWIELAQTSGSGIAGIHKYFFARSQRFLVHGAKPGERHENFTPHFQHVFAGDGYSAGYYSYIWSDTLSADAWEAFTAAGGAYDKAVAKRLRDDIFSIGNTVDPAEAYKKFRGREPGIAALMRKRGFPVPADGKTE